MADAVCECSHTIVDHPGASMGACIRCGDCSFFRPRNASAVGTPVAPLAHG